MSVLASTAVCRAEDLMRRVLRGGRELAGEYPLVFGPVASAELVTVESEEGALLSTCAAVPRTLRVGAVEVPAGFIGSVATEPEHRGHGHGTSVLARAEAWLAERGAAVAVLWADDASFYEKRGYVPFGTELDFVIEHAHAELLPAPVAVREACPDDTGAIHALYMEHEERVDRTFAETSALLAVPGMDLLVRERHGRVCAYAARGRGEDLAQVVHEWAGEAQDVLALTRAHLDRMGGGKLVLMVPPSRIELARYFEVVEVPGMRGVLGMAKLVSLPATARLFERLGGSGCACVPVGDAGLRLTGPEGSIDMTPAEALLGLMPPRGDRTVANVLEAQTGLQFPALPLDVFVWGLDSV